MVRTLALLAAAGVATDSLMVMDEAGTHYHPGQSATLRMGPRNILASFGTLHPATAKAFDLDGPVIFAANHHSHLDTPLMITSIPTPWRHHLVVGAAAGRPIAASKKARCAARRAESAPPVCGVEAAWMKGLLPIVVTLLTLGEHG